MSVDQRLQLVRDAERRAVEAAGRAEALLGGGGGGTSGGGMDERVIRLEGDVGRLRTDVAELRIDMRTAITDLATLKERVAHLPSKGFILTATSATIGVIGTIVLLADRLRTLF